MENTKLSNAIRNKYKTESRMAKAMGWNRQRLNKITRGLKEPDVADVVEISKALGLPVEQTIGFFIP